MYFLPSGTRLPLFVLVHFLSFSVVVVNLTTSDVSVKVGIRRGLDVGSFKGNNENK